MICNFNNDQFNIEILINIKFHNRFQVSLNVLKPICDNSREKYGGFLGNY